MDDPMDVDLPEVIYLPDVMDVDEPYIAPRGLSWLEHSSFATSRDGFTPSPPPRTAADAAAPQAPEVPNPSLPPSTPVVRAPNGPTLVFAVPEGSSEFWTESSAQETPTPSPIARRILSPRSGRVSTPTHVLPHRSDDNIVMRIPGAFPTVTVAGQKRRHEEVEPEPEPEPEPQPRPQPEPQPQREPQRGQQPGPAPIAEPEQEPERHATMAGRFKRRCVGAYHGLLTWVGWRPAAVAEAHGAAVVGDHQAPVQETQQQGPPEIEQAAAQGAQQADAQQDAEPVLDELDSSVADREEWVFVDVVEDKIPTETIFDAHWFHTCPVGTPDKFGPIPQREDFGLLPLDRPTIRELWAQAFDELEAEEEEARRLKSRASGGRQHAGVMTEEQEARPLMPRLSGDHQHRDVVTEVEVARPFKSPVSGEHQRPDIVTQEEVARPPKSPVSSDCQHPDAVMQEEVARPLKSPVSGDYQHADVVAEEEVRPLKSPVSGDHQHPDVVMQEEVARPLKSPVSGDYQHADVVAEEEVRSLESPLSGVHQHRDVVAEEEVIPLKSSLSGVHQHRDVVVEEEVKPLKSPLSGDHQHAGVVTQDEAVKIPEVTATELTELSNINAATTSLTVSPNSRRVSEVREKKEKRRQAAEARKKTRQEAEERAKAEKAQKEAERKSLLEQANKKKLVDRIITALNPEWEKKVDKTMSSGLGSKEVAWTSTGHAITKKDFESLVPPKNSTTAPWLNDEIINAYLGRVIDYGLEKAHARQNGNQRATRSRDKPGTTPKYHAFNSFFYTNLRDKGPESVSRWLKKANMDGKKLYDVDHIFIPVNQSSHWTLIVISPSKRRIEYFDSLGGSKTPFINNIKALLRAELKRDYKEKEWKIENTKSPVQNNSFDCGVFAVTTAKMIMMGIDPMSYNQRDIPTQRRRMAAELMNGGFHGDFAPELED